jgi:amino-acid N-acetyltransferase
LSEVIRETLRYWNRWRGKTFLLAIAPIGSVNQTDLDLLVPDIQLLQNAGLNICFALNSDEFIQRLRTCIRGCDLFRVSNLQETIDKAIALGASKICLLCGADAIHFKRDVLDDLSVKEAEAILTKDGLTPDAKEALSFLVQACQRGIPRAHIFNAHHSGVLLEELFTGKGSGVMVYNESTWYKQIRRARSEDLLTVSHILVRSQGRLTLEYVKNHITDFLVFAVDGEIYGCVRVVKNGNTLELQNFSCLSRFDEQEVFQEFVQAVSEKARAENFGRVAIFASELPGATLLKSWFSDFQKEKIQGDPSREAWVRRVS